MTHRRMGVLAGWLMCAAVGTAHAHAHLLQSTPADGSVLATPPASFEFKFNEAATLTALSLQKAGEAEQKLPLTDAKAATDISVAAPTLAAGSYTLVYRIVSADHHIVAGRLQFKVGG